MTVISPVSALVDAGLSESRVKTARIASSIDLLNFGPVSGLYGDDPDKAPARSAAYWSRPARRRLEDRRRGPIN